MRRLIFCLSVCAALPASSPARADEEVFSGPQAGEKVSPFKVLGVLGEHAGKEVDYVKDADGKPTLFIFVHEITRPAAGLMRMLTHYSHSRGKDGLRTYVVWLHADRTDAEGFLKRAEKSLNLPVPVGVSLDGAEGPGAYGLNRKVSLTILVVNDNKVSANFALVQPSVTDAPKIAEAVTKVAGGKPPTLDELNKIAFPDRPPQVVRPAAGIKDQQLVGLLRGVIRPDATADQVKDAAAAVEKYVGDDKDRQQTLGDAARRIEKAGYGSDPGKEQIKAWAKKYPAQERKDR
jgi:hypothetical protein